MSVVESVTTPGRTGVELVRKFEALSCADIPFAGGKGSQSRRACRGRLSSAAGLRGRRHGIRRVLRPHRLRDRITAGPASVDVDDPAGLELAAHDVQALIAAERLPADIDAAIRSAYGELRRRFRCARRCALLRDRRRHPGRLVRQHERDLPEHARRRCGRRGRQALLGLALRRPDDLLPLQQGAAAGRDGHRRGRPAPDPFDPSRSDVHDRPSERIARLARDRGRVRPR